ncbi:autotransporter outer membrane beta-barrel domain-containing protein [Megasphaera massiliensis]|nr:autotransporter outer membrane beta-barrel domain-containing protein [Megasphaera massiliensis]
MNLKAKGNIIFHEEQASNPVAINMESDADFQMEAQTISGNMQRMTMVAGGSNFNLKADDLQWGAPVGQSVEAVAPKNDPMLTSMISAGRSSTVKLDLGNSAKLANEITGTLLYTNFGSLTMNAGDSIYLHNTGYKSDDKFQSLIRLQGGTIDLTAGEGILLDNKGAIAVLSEYYGEVNFNGKTAINGAGIGAFAPGGGIINFNGNTVMSQVGTGASASESGTINFNGNTVMSQVDIGALTETDSDPWAEELTKINFEDDVVIDQAETGVSASYNSDIVFNKGLSIDAKDNAFYTESAGRIQALATGEDKVIKGNMQALNGQIDVLLDTEKSSFTGATELQKIEKVYSWDDEEYEDDDIIYDDEEDWDDEDDGDDWEMPYVEETPTINLTLKNGAVWNVTGDSTLTNLENDSFVNLSNTDRTGTSLTAQTLSGTGTMVMDLDWNSNGGAKEKTDNSDYLNVTESATGTQALVTDKASMHLDAMGVDDRLYFATLTNSDAVFTSPITQRNVQKGHLYDYIIGINSETTATTDTSDTAETVADRAAVDTTTDWFFGTIGYTESPIVETGRINSQIMYDLVTDVDTLNKRMGDVRHMNTDPDGWWARTTYTHQDRDSYSGHSNRFELGKDFVMTRSDGSTVHQGTVFTYLRSTDSFADGNGKYNRYSGALYHTWLGNDGRYVDFVGRIGKVMGNSHTFLVNGDQSDSSFGTWYQQASVETGRNYDLKDGWYFEPQAQLQYTHMNSKSYTSSDGINHDLDSVNSFIGRLGFRLGQNINEKTSWYVKGDILHEFSGDGGIMLTSSNGLERINYSRDGKDTWYDLGAGLTTELSPASSLWFEFERKFSGTYSNDWEFNGGIAWKF